jgi:hypothetical protein
MTLEIAISVLLLIDSAFALLIAFTTLGDNTIEQNIFIKRYLPLTKGWSVLYFSLSLYIGYLTVLA